MPQGQGQDAPECHVERAAAGSSRTGRRNGGAMVMTVVSGNPAKVIGRRELRA